MRPAAVGGIFDLARYSGAIPSSVAGRFGMVPSTGSRLMERLISHKPTLNEAAVRRTHSRVAEPTVEVI